MDLAPGPATLRLSHAFPLKFLVGDMEARHIVIDGKIAECSSKLVCVRLLSYDGTTPSSKRGHVFSRFKT
jgi:hypothetical protein